MFYYIFDYLDRYMDVTGAGVFKYISFRAGMAAILSLLISIVFGRKIINMLRKLQIGEGVRDLGLEGQKEKEGTPTMGGIIIIAAMVIPTLLFARVTNIYIVLLVGTALWLGTVGFLDDYLKIRMKNKEGLAGKFKIIGQVTLGLMVGLVLVFHPDVVVRTFGELTADGFATFTDAKSVSTTLPFVKDNNFEYTWLLPDALVKYTWIVYVLVVIFIITAVSNGANITDGIDGLAAGTSAIIALTLAILAYLSGNAVFSEYLDIMFIPDSGELVIFCAALLGACIGFLWYNSYPAQVFMGDTGSLALGGVIAVLAFTIRKEFLIPILCGIFLVENLSVIIQVLYFKYTKKRYGEGRRILKMSPLHHHYQIDGVHESKIVNRFWTVGILLAILTLATLKLR